MMNMVNKETAIKDYLAMIKQSWTWAKLTDDEKNKFGDELNKASMQKIISGTYRQRWGTLSALYSMFLEGCGYSGCNWRD